MEFVNISGTNITSSRIGLGTWAIGGWLWGGSDEKDSIDTIIKAFDSGINLIDTAPVYGFGLSEEIVGKAVSKIGRREELIIATKVGLEWHNSKVFRNSTKERIYAEIEDSLKRLKTDYIDIYQIHWPDPLTPLEETAEAVLKLKEKGVIRAIGVSNYSPLQMDIFCEIVKIQTSQPPYNLFERDIDKDVLPYCHEKNITMLLYGALCRGLLSGRMRIDTKFEGDDLRKFDPKFKRPRYDQYINAVTILDQFAKERFGKNVLKLSIRWMLDCCISDIALWGARRPDQLSEINSIFDWSIDSDTMRRIDKILDETVINPVGPEFMAPPAKN